MEYMRDVLFLWTLGRGGLFFCVLEVLNVI